MDIDIIWAIVLLTVLVLLWLFVARPLLERRKPKPYSETKDLPDNWFHDT